MVTCSLRLAALLTLLGAAAPAAIAQSFVDNVADIPAFGTVDNDSTSENVDFGDIDLDGDWDAVFADGGDGGTVAAQDQNRVWVNQGGLQAGSLGRFLDETSARLPLMNDQSRDIELVDIEADGDLDLYVSNTSEFVPDTNRWLVNVGGLQGGTTGFYQDETATRWVGLGAPGSSVPSSFVLPGGGFQDWSCDCDFGDLDNDGDLDLVHSSYGGAFGGNVPTRIFLNDGAGFFSEFNPSGFQVPTMNIANGDPGIWCEGVQQAHTTNSDGTFCDVASTPLDIDLGDIDGDYDLDILHGARQEAPRMFASRLDGSPLAPALGGGALGFRDVTGMVFPPGYVTGNGHYEQEMGDLDGDGDLDIYGLNWLINTGVLTDLTLRNTGNGVYADVTPLPGSFNSDGNEGDFLDYDNDGDLDLFVCAFTGSNRLYQNQNDGGSSFSFLDLSAEIPLIFLTFLDVDVCDVDGDGDYDVFGSTDANFGQPPRNVYFQNITGVPDTTAPYLPNLEQVVRTIPGPDPTVIRVHVYDNAPYYITAFNETWLEVRVDGGAAMVFPMSIAGGQVFRGEVPGALFGDITYQAFSQDEYGNVGSSAILTYGDPPPPTPGDCNENGIPDVDELASQDLDQWAATVLGFSSEYSASAFGSIQALFAPNTFSYGANGTTWSPLLADGGPQWISLGYASPVFADGVTVRETEGNGFVTEIELLDTDDVYHSIWAGVDPSPQGVPVDFFVPFPETTYLVKGVRVTTDTQTDPGGWESIDAVRLHGRAPASSMDSNGNGLLDECEDVGSRYCATSPNSASAIGSVILGSGSASVAFNDLSLAAGPMGAGQPGLFYYGTVQLQLAFGNGFRCVGGATFRLLPASFADASGVLSRVVDLANPPPGGQVTPGSTWNFQAWFRDPAGGGAGFNLSDGLSVTFLP